VVPGIVLGQGPDCIYDPSNPSLDNARKNFLGLNYHCAELELLDLLKKESLNTQERADAHVLLAEVYYAKVRNESEKKDKVIEQFVAAFNAYREWRGELNIKSPEFMTMMKEAQEIVDKGMQEPEEVVTEEKRVEVPKKEKKKKPWYTQWWAIGLGVGIVAGGVVLLTSGGEEEEEPALDTLGYFPEPPSKRR
jgi:hypothetical protein